MSSVPETLGWLVKRLQHRNHRALERELAPLGVSLVQWNALREIARHPDCSQHALAELTFNSPQAFGTLVTRLQSSGLIERRPVRGRAARHGLTPRGEALLKSGAIVMTEVTTRTFGALPIEGQVQLASLLTQVLDGD